MYLSQIMIKNYRKYGDPGISVDFEPELNVLIGENASGKSTIVDAIRYVLKTQSMEYTRLSDIDFHWNDLSIEDDKQTEIPVLLFLMVYH